MVPDISRGSFTRGLLRYLYGPGRRDEHTDPHQVASWDGFAPDPGRDPAVTPARLARQLDAPVVDRSVRTGRPVRQHVWHCPVRASPGDRHLSDQEWADVARRVVHAAGIAPDGDADGCRWVAVRHADDHIHIVATLVRQDGRLPRHHKDAARVQAECRRIEADHGLRRLHPGDGTAARAPRGAERAKAARRGKARTAREELRDRVRSAAAGAVDEGEFFTRLRASGARTRTRTGPSGTVLGYSVALPGDRNRHGEPVWFPGSTLAPDLSLPRFRTRFTAGPSPQRTVRPRADHRPRPSEAWRRAAVAVEAERAGPSSSPERSAADVTGLAEVLDAAAATAPPSVRDDLRVAASAYERASRSRHPGHRIPNRELRAAARGMLRAGRALGHGQDGAAVTVLLSAALVAAVSAARWHASRGHHQQSAAARRAAGHLRTAYATSATPALRRLHAHGMSLPRTVVARHAGTVRSVLPEAADRILAEPAWPALASLLENAHRSGLPAADHLRRAAGSRELDTAVSVSEVLIWRLRGRLPTVVGNPPACDRPRHPSQGNAPGSGRRRR